MGGGGREVDEREEFWRWLSQSLSLLSWLLAAIGLAYLVLTVGR